MKTYARLRQFVERKMRMSHVYQPLMIKCLLTNGGTCSESDVARVLLIGDKSQIEYYGRITRDMVGRVLRRHEVVARHKGSYVLEGYSDLSTSQIEELIALCDEKVADFIEKRGDRIWDHRRKSSGYISGIDRYDVLKRAKFRCELCGISADLKALEVDHIVPRNKGGTDEQENLQALCYSCNSMKRDMDATDHRVYKSMYDDRMEGCPFCELEPDRVISNNQLAVAVFDAYPVTNRHALIITRRHVASYFDLGRPELNACNQLLDRVSSQLKTEDPTITAFNIGINDGKEAGQTVMHCHIHLIPRRPDDVENPTGGVRAVIPGEADYT